MTTTDKREVKQAQVATDVASVSERLLQHYRKEDELYRSILKLTELQHTNLAHADDIRDFITLLHQKEDLIRAIDKLELQVEDEKAAWLEVPEDEKGHCNEGLNKLLDNIISLIERIMRVERQNEQFLRDRKDEVEQQLDAIRKGCEAAKEYKPKPDAKVISAIT